MAVEVLVFDDERETPRLLSRGAAPIRKFRDCLFGARKRDDYAEKEIQWTT